MNKLITEACERAKKEMEEIERVDPTLVQKLRAEGRRCYWRTVDEMLDDPRKGQAKSINDKGYF